MSLYSYDSKQYNKLETVLQYISGNFVTLDEDDINTINPVLRNILDVIIMTMENIDPLFKEMFERLMYGGSYYEGLKIGTPNEFDIDMVLRLPKILNVNVDPASEPGFVNVILQDWDRLMKDKNLYTRYKHLDTLQDEYNYLIQDRVLHWIQKLVAKAINSIHNDALLQNTVISFSMGGPAATLHILHKETIEFDVDLVAVFRMRESNWLDHPFRPNTSRRFRYFYVVPKSPKSEVTYKTRCWRLSFQEQEQVLLNNHNYCKSALRLLKKLRDTRDHNIPSYFIKTIFLWKLEDDIELFQNKSLNFIFMEMLNTYKNYLSNSTIPYYWNKNNNLLQYTNYITTYNITNYLERMINTIHRNIDSDPYIIAKFLLPTHEYDQLVLHFKGTNYECARNDIALYDEFNKNNDETGFSFSNFLVGATAAAVITALVFLNNLN